MGTTNGCTPQCNDNRRATSGEPVAARMGAAGLSDDSTRAVLPWRVIATMAVGIAAGGQRHRRIADRAAVSGQHRRRAGDLHGERRQQPPRRG